MRFMMLYKPGRETDTPPSVFTDVETICNVLTARQPA